MGSCQPQFHMVSPSAHGPGAEPWEVYTVKGDAGTLAKAEDSACCTPGGAAREVPASGVPAAATTGCC